MKILYEYVEGTDLLKKKVTLTDKEVFKEELFRYDKDHCLIRVEEKSGPVHKIERILPSKETPFGFPLKKKHFARTPDGDVFLESYHYKYNSRGDTTHEEKRDAFGKTIFSIEREFDPHGNCLYERNSLGFETFRNYDSNDNCIKEKGPRPGLVKKFVYDYMNRCVEESLSFEGETWVVHHVYNQLNQKIETIDELGHSTKWVYDRYGRALKTELPEVEVHGSFKKPLILRKFDCSGHEIETVDPLGNKTTKKFTAHHKPYLIQHPDGATEKTIFSLEGWPLKTVDAEGFVTKYTYDALGRVLTTTTPNGTTACVYQGHYLVKKVDEEGVETHFKYDPFGRLIETKKGNRRESLTYDNQGHPYRKSHYEDEKLLSTEVSFIDPLGRVIEKFLEDPSGTIFNRELFTYDAAGNCIMQWRGVSKITRTFDGKNRITSVTDGEGHQHLVFYEETSNTFGQRLLQKRVVDPNGEQVITIFDSLGRASKIVHLNPIGVPIKTENKTFDLAGNLVKEEIVGQGEIRVLIKEFDSRGRIISLIEPLEKIAHMKYTPSGQLQTLTKPDGIKLHHTYKDGRLSALTSSDGRLSYHYTYNKRGELIEVRDEVTGLTSLQTFSPLGDLIKEVLPNGETIHYTYDGLGRVTSYSLPDGGKALLSYNARAVTEISRIDSSGNPLYRHAYTGFDEVGNVITQKHLGKAGTTRFSYDSLYQLTGVNNPYWQEEKFIYDDAGNLLSLEQNGEKLSFDYDDLYQLVLENQHAYTFDPFYNRRSKDDDSYAVNALNQLLATSHGRFSYDANGNCIVWESGEKKLLFSYDPLNRLIAIEEEGAYVEFTYDPFHRRLTRNGEPFHFFREQEIGFQNELRILGPGLGGDIGAAIAIELEGEFFAPLHDYRGNVVALVDKEGDLVASWSFTAYGECLGTCSSPWGFASKRTEPLTGWLSFGRRDYDSVTGRWTTPDPLGFEGGLNLYTYVSNRPLLHRDPLGLLDDANSEFYSFAEQSHGSILEWGARCLDTCLSCVGYFFKDDIANPHYDRDQNYPTGTYLADRYCDWDSLKDKKYLGYGMNGIGTSKSTFESNYDYVHQEIHPYMDHVMRYNPSHGDGFINECKDLWRACLGLLGMVREDLVSEVRADWDRVFSITSPDFRIFIEPHSEANIVFLHALKEYNPLLKERISFLALCPAAYGRPDVCGDYSCITTSTDAVTFVDVMGRTRVDSANAWIAKSAIIMDHELQSPTIKPHWKKGADSFYETGKISFR